MFSSERKASGRPPLHARFADEARFLKAWVENPAATGAVSPSGQHLARMMARYADPSVPGPVVELGPGTGPVTQALIERGFSEDRLILVEYDAAFCALLQDRFPAATIIQGDAYDLPTTLKDVLCAPAAAIVSSLPLLNRPEEDRLQMLKDAFGLLETQGNIVQFTYGMVSPIPRKPGTGAETAFVAEASPPVWRNIPPARVWSYRQAGEIISLEQARKRFSLKEERNKLLKRWRAGADRIKEQTFRVRDGLLDKRDNIETELRLAREAVRIDFELRVAQLRETKRLDQHLDRHIKPALALVRRLGDARRERR